MDEEYYYEPSAADAIICEAKEQLLSLLTEEAKSTLSSAVKAKEELRKLDNEICYAKQRLNDIVWQQKREEEKLANMKNHSLPREFVKRIVTNLTGDYAPGDTVFIIASHTQYDKCPMCNGAQKVSAIIGEDRYDVQCPRCNGYGQVHTDSHQVVEKKVSEVRVKLCFEADRVNRWSTDSVFLNGCDFSISPENLYRTTEDAEKAMLEKYPEEANAN